MKTIYFCSRLYQNSKYCLHPFLLNKHRFLLIHLTLKAKESEGMFKRAIKRAKESQREL